MFHEDLQDRATTIRAKARTGQPEMGGTSGREYVSSATSLDT